MRQRLFVVVALLALAFAWTGNTWAKGFYLGDWSDGDLVEHVHELIDKAGDISESDAAICLNNSMLYQTKSEKYTKTTNREYLFLDEAASDLADQSFTVGLNAKIKKASGWVLRVDGTLERLEKDDIIRRDGSDSRVGEVVLSFPKLREGDAMGYSMEVEFDRSLDSATILLARAYATISGSVIIQTSGRHSYVLTARNLTEDRIELSRDKKRKGSYRLILAKYQNVPPLRSEIYGEPRVKSAAHIDLLRTHDFVEIGKEWAWFSNNTWNQQARSGMWIGRWYTASDAVKKQAKKLSAAGGTERTARRIYDFVVRQIQTVDRSEFTLGLASSPSEVLESREGSANEKSLLLYGLMFNAGLSSDVAYLRSYYMGKLKNQTPNLLNFYSIAVRGGSGEWYWPGDASTAMGELPPWLRKSTALVPFEDIGTRFDKAYKNAAREFSGSLVQFYKDYTKLLQGREWYEMFKTGGDPFEVYSDLATRLVVDPLDETMAVHMRVNGADASAIRHESDNDAAVRERIEALLEGQLSTYEVETQDIEVGGVTSQGGNSEVECVVPSTAIPDPSGGVWVLPMADLVAGREFEEWEGQDRGPMFVSVTKRETLEVSLPLPDGWVHVKPIAPFVLQNPRLDYRVDVMETGGRLLIRRTCVLKAGTTEQHRIVDMDSDIGRILAFESTPLVLEAL
jgi:hypothetical protein